MRQRDGSWEYVWLFALENKGEDGCSFPEKQNQLQKKLTQPFRRVFTSFIQKMFVKNL